MPFSFPPDDSRVADYAAVRSYAGNSKNLYVTGYLVTGAPSGIAGPFTVDDTDTTSADNGGTILVITSGVNTGKRVRRVFSGLVDVRWFGAKVDGATDDSAAFNAAAALGGGVFVPAGTSVLAAAVTMGANTYFVGAGRNATVIQPAASYASGPLFARTNYANINAGGSDNCGLESMKLIDNRTTSAYWTVDFSNGNSCYLKNVEIDSSVAGVSLLTGVYFGLKTGSTYTGATFLPRIEDCRFSGCSVVINTTDWWIGGDTQIWGATTTFNREFAIMIGGGGTIAPGVQLVGGRDGIIKLKNDSNFDIETLKVVGVYFDGSYTSVSAANAIYSDGLWTGNLRDATIVGNNFWHMDAEAIRVANVYGGVIANNTFDDCDARDAAKADINVGNAFGLNIGPNSHSRSTNAPKTGVARANLGAPLRLTATAGTNVNRVIGGTVYFSSAYVAAVYTNEQYIDVQSASPLLRLNRTVFPNASEFAHTLITLSGADYISDGAQWWPIARYTTSIGANGNFNSQTIPGSYDITDTTGWSNGPAGLVGAPYILEVFVINSQYMAQRLQKFGVSTVNTRRMDAGVWTAWA